MDNEALKPKERTDGFAIASFILAMLSFVVGPLGFWPAIILGHLSRSRIRKDPSLVGDRFAKAGLVIGYIFLAVSIYLASPGIIHSLHSYFTPVR